MLALTVICRAASSRSAATPSCQARRAASAGTEIVAVSPQMGPVSIEGHYDEAFAAVGVIDEVRKGEAEGCDGYVIACFGDPGLLAAREMGVEPSRCLVVEDSRPGVIAARAAGMEVAVFAGGSHYAGLGGAGLARMFDMEPPPPSFWRVVAGPEWVVSTNPACSFTAAGSSTSRFQRRRIWTPSSWSATWSAKTGEPKVCGHPSRAWVSFTANGRPCRGPVGSPEA